MDLAEKSEQRISVLTFKGIFLYRIVTVDLNNGFAEERPIPSPLLNWLYKKPKQLLKALKLGK